MHVSPINDLREHITDGSPCPCMPRLVDGVMVHNSYDGREIGEVCAKALDLLACSLANHHHHWSEEEREAYDHAVLILNMHFDLPPIMNRPPEADDNHGQGRTDDAL